ncbi:GTPase IMAP family member 8 [Astyanax mexicanus]|uniref:GTPase IMAP family member 8 n=1 Tax=Astyanax mexicanus TaxID=7994 RepID=UPI0020CAC55E|nr:GTPase IMAP family member 8 [Astyanax mexicanus]
MTEAHGLQGSESAPEGAHHLTEMKILLLGNKASGKSASIRTILGSEEPDVKTAQCVKIQGESAGVEVTVVEAPGWWRNYTVKDGPNLNAEEIVLSASLCSPGPHVVLLVIRLDTHFTKTCREALKERQGLFLSESIWSHSMVLFTFGDCLRDTTLEKHIESEGEALQWLVKKCGNRFHVFNNKNRNDSRQVQELLGKIEDMVKINSGGTFEVDSQLLQDFEIRRRRDEMKAMERLIRVQKQKQDTACRTGDQTQPELRIVLVGHRHSGKSSAGNTILGSEEFELRRTSKCVMKEAKVAGRQVTVVEAPGWWNNYCLNDSSKLTKQELLHSVSLCPPGPHVLLLVLRVDGSFTKESTNPVKEHLELFGLRVWDYTMVLFTYGDWLGETSIEQHIESEGEALQWLVEKCGNRYHLLNNYNRGDSVQVTELLEQIEGIVAENDPQYYEVSSEILEEVQKGQRTVEENANLSMLKVMKNRTVLKWLKELRIAMLGRLYSGKSSSGNTILGSDVFSLERSSYCVRHQAKVGTREIVLVEVPTWSPCVTAQSVKECVTLCAPGPHAVLFVIQADTSFTETERRSLEVHMKLLDERGWNYSMVLFTCGDWLGDWTIEEYIKSEGQALCWLVEKCGNRYHVLNNQDKGDDAQVMELLDKIEEMVAGNGGHLVVQPPEMRSEDTPFMELLDRTEKKQTPVIVLQPPPTKFKRKHHDGEVSESLNFSTNRMDTSQHDEDNEEKPKTDQENDTLDEATPTFPDKDESRKFIDMNVHKAHSMQHLQPTMGGDDDLETSSGYSSEASHPGSIDSNLYGSLMSMASSVSSGIGSLRIFGAQRSESVKDFMKRPKPEEDNTGEMVQDKLSVLEEDNR